MMAEWHLWNQRLYVSVYQLLGDRGGWLGGWAGNRRKVLLASCLASVASLANVLMECTPLMGQLPHLKVLMELAVLLETELAFVVRRNLFFLTFSWAGGFFLYRMYLVMVTHVLLIPSNLIYNDELWYYGLDYGNAKGQSLKMVWKFFKDVGSESCSKVVCWSKIMRLYSSSSAWRTALVVTNCKSSVFSHSFGLQPENYSECWQAVSWKQTPVAMGWNNTSQDPAREVRTCFFKRYFQFEKLRSDALIFSHLIIESEKKDKLLLNWMEQAIWCEGGPRCRQ